MILRLLSNDLLLGIESSKFAQSLQNSYSSFAFAVIANVALSLHVWLTVTFSPDLYFPAQQKFL